MKERLTDEIVSVVLALVRKVINPSAEIHIPKGLDWRTVIEYARQQGLLALCFDALELIDAEQRPPKNILFEWMGQVVMYEKYYSKYKDAIRNLAAFYSEHSIKMLVLKGYGLSLDWPKPNHRPIGDIDIYLFNEWQRADILVYNKLGVKIEDGHEHHTIFNYMDFAVENHYDFINTKVMSYAVSLEKWFKQEANNAYVHNLSETIVYLPSAQLNAIFLMRHLGSHFSGSEATLRQILDWAFFIDNHSKEVDWDNAVAMLKSIGIYKFFCQINAICVDYLGISETKFPPIERDEYLKKRIFQDILMPQIIKIDRSNGLLKVVALKIKRFLANGWKRKLVYNDSLLKQFLRGSIAHIRRYKTIKD